ncbi:hypothetical protein C0989_012081 [Termitomyces sp. Mn162]|nr:hypothetical protein C0989_012081 [Termitomyces sp. Mn162]
MVDSRAWWEVVMDMGEPLPEHPDVLVIVVAQLEVDMLVLGVPGLGGVLLMEVLELVRGSVKVSSEFLSVVLRSITLPVDQVLGMAVDHVGVENLVDLIVIFILDFDRGQSAGVLPRERVWSMFFGEADVEHWVEALQAWGQVKLVGMHEDLSENFEEAKAFMVEFDGGPPGLEVALIEPNQSAGGPVRGRIMSGISMFGIGLISSADFVLEELVEGLEILGNFVSDVGRDIFEG